MATREELIKQYNQVKVEKEKAYSRLAAAREKVDMVAKPDAKDLAEYDAAQKAYRQVHDKLEGVKAGFWKP